MDSPSDQSTPAYVTPTVVADRPVAPPSGSRSRAVGCVAILLGIGLAMSLLFNIALVGGGEGLGGGADPHVKEKFHSLNRRGSEKIALLEISGAIMDGESVKRVIDAIERDDKVKALVLRVDSPGGTVTASDYIYHHLSQLTEKKKIPMVVSMGGIAASGGYYVAMAAGHRPGVIFAEPTTWTGSIGVIIPHYNFAGFLEEHKITEDSIKSHPLKAIGSFTRPMSEQERKILQGLVDDSFVRFKEIVKSGRAEFAEHPEKLDDVATGQVYSADQAKEKGLVDEIGYIEEAIERAVELAGVDKDKAKVVKFQHEVGFLDLLSGAEVNTQPLGLSQLLDLTAPRAYYMCTWLPALDAMLAPRSK